MDMSQISKELLLCLELGQHFSMEAKPIHQVDLIMI
jgi:hypothetical protein